MLITLFDDILTIIHQHDLYCQLCEGVIGEEDEAFANIKKDEIDAKKRESVTFVDMSSNLLIRTLVGNAATLPVLSNSFYILSLSCKTI